MAYTTTNFRSKADLKRALADRKIVTAFNPGLGPDLSRYSGDVYLEGPHSPEPHRWYAKARMKDGQIITVS